MTVLVIAEHDNQSLKAATLNTVAAAQQLSEKGAGDIVVLVAGAGCAAVGDAAAKIAGVSKILVAEDSGLEHSLAENMSALVTGLAKDYSHILAPATTFGKNFMPRVAALLDVQQISEISAVEDADTFVRPIYAGNAIATVKSADTTKVITVRATTFDPAAADGGSATTETIAAAADKGVSTFIELSEASSDRPELTSARVIISGGRGMASGKNYVLIEPIADKLGAAMGASRAAVDAGFVPNDWQVGQTGKVVAPELYIAVGISGAIQHLAGMKDSKVIVAINKDAEAPIFQVADFGLVADLFTALPELNNELEKQL
jgi:electron transfer flavoprotein alpha subunit